MRRQTVEPKWLPMACLATGLALSGQAGAVDGGRPVARRSTSAELGDYWRAVECVLEATVTDVLRIMPEEPFDLRVLANVQKLAVARVYGISKTADGKHFPKEIYITTNFAMDSARLVPGKRYLLFLKDGARPIIDPQWKRTNMPLPDGPYFEIVGGWHYYLPVDSPAYGEALEFLRAQGVDMDTKIVPGVKTQGSTGAAGAAAKTGNWKENEWAVEAKMTEGMWIEPVNAPTKTVGVQVLSVERLYHAAEKSQAPRIGNIFYMTTHVRSPTSVRLTVGKSYLLILKAAAVPQIAPAGEKLNKPLPVGPYFEVVDGWHGCYPVDSPTYKKAFDFLRAEGIDVDAKVPTAAKPENAPGTPTGKSAE